MPLVTDLPVRVVVFASEQLFPALNFLLHAAHQYGTALRSIHIYCTPDERRSGAPARRLQGVMQRWGVQHGLDFSVEITTGDMWPEAVRAGLLDWYEAHPDSHWLVNVTGGTKPMSAAAIELTLATSLASRRVIYQEIDGQWVELVQNDASRLLSAHQLLAEVDAAIPRADTLDQLLRVEDLVGTQFSDQHRITTQDLPRLPIDQATREVIAQRWRWNIVWRTLGLGEVSGGIAFEQFIGAGLADCGVHLKSSLKVHNDDAEGKTVREVDLVGCYQGRLVCIDIKLPGAEAHAKGTQLADVAELAHSLGGRGALAIAVRPGWAEDSGTCQLAKSLGVKLLTQADAARPFSQILSWIDRMRTLSSAAQVAEQLLQAQQARGSDVLSDGRRIVATLESNTLHLPNEIANMAEHQKQCWALVQLAPGQYWLGVTRQSEYAPAESDWFIVEERLFALIRQVSCWYDSPPVSKAWLTVHFKSGQGIKLATVLKEISNIFHNTPSL